jgi:hypothetical protein
VRCDSAWDKPTPSPEAALENLRYNYAEDVEDRRLQYIDDIAECVASWFLTNYEDPVHSTPWDEGAYVYIWGGPLDTREIVEDALLRVVPDEEREEFIEATLQKIEELGSCGDVCVPLFGRYGQDDTPAGHFPPAGLPPDDPHDDFLTTVSG